MREFFRLLEVYAIVALVLAVFVAESAAGAEAEVGDAPPAPVQAVWKEQEVNFFFQSLTTFYSCDGLRDKLRKILTALGARGNVRVDSADCQASVVRNPRVTLKLSAPIEATDEALAEWNKARSQRELTARVRGESAAEDAPQPFAAQWRTVALSRGELGLESGDCELIEELQRKVLPKLAVRVVKDDVRCTPYRVTPGQPRLEVEALVEVPKPDQAPDQPSR